MGAAAAMSQGSAGSSSAREGLTIRVYPEFRSSWAFGMDLKTVRPA